MSERELQTQAGADGLSLTHVVGSAIVYGRVLIAIKRLDSADALGRRRAMETLRGAGQAAIGPLHWAVEHQSAISQLAAAVVLHWLGDPKGMATLVGFVQWRLQGQPDLAPEIERAFILVGAPDAVTALLTIWNQTPEWVDGKPALALICRIWAGIKDPRALDALVERAPRIPDLFEETAPQFGEMAVLHLERMTRARDSDRRILAIRALRHIASARSFSVLMPLLRGPDPMARALAAQALVDVGGLTSAARAIGDAIVDGYSTAEAVEIICRSGAPPADLLRSLVRRWDPQSSSPARDTSDAVAAAITVLDSLPEPPEFCATLCSLIERQPAVTVLTAAARALGTHALAEPGLRVQAREALVPLVSFADADVRRHAGTALANLGDPLGKSVEQAIEDCRPRETLPVLLQTVLRGGADPGQIASQAVQQVSQWMGRAAKEFAARLDSSSAARPAGPMSDDPRMGAALQSLLGNALDTVAQAGTLQEIEDRLSLSVAAVRALARFGAPSALCARDELVRALRTVRMSMVYLEPGSGQFRRSETRDVAVVLRAAAAQGLLQLYGAASFALFLEALYWPNRAVQDTAITALGATEDPRAIPHLQSIARDPDHPHATLAARSIEAITKARPEIRELLRASAAGMRPEALLRPAADTVSARPETLLRPGGREAETATESASE